MEGWNLDKSNKKLQFSKNWATGRRNKYYYNYYFLSSTKFHNLATGNDKLIAQFLTDAPQNYSLRDTRLINIC